MKKMKKYADGGDIPEGGRFAGTDPDIYARARRFTEQATAGGDESEEEAAPAMKAPRPMPRPKPRPMATASVKPAAKPAAKESSYFSGKPGSAGPRKMGYAKGGSVSSRADGIASRGRTNCKMV